MLNVGFEKVRASLSLYSRLSITCLGVLALIHLEGCASLPPSAKAESFAVPANEADPLVKLAEASAPAEQGSIFRPMPYSNISMDTRLALIKRASHTLDLQYYLLQDDHTGRTLLRAVRDAAQRGVRVRILVDDLYTDTSEQLLLDLSATPNIEIRVFNPFPAGRSSELMKWALSLDDFSRLNHRMHNKLFIADGAFAIAGGRNMADEYFFQSQIGNFIDFDLLLAGDAVPRLESIFDTYWNSPRVYPLLSLDSSRGDPTTRQAAFQSETAGDARFASAPASGQDPLGFLPFSQEASEPRLTMLSGQIDTFADTPEKVSGRAEKGDDTSTVTSHFLRAVSEANTDVLLVSPYFVPGDQGMATLQKIRARGVKVTLITNTVGGNDEPLASAAYATYRARMLQMGVDIYEVSSLGLHANKAVGAVIERGSIGRSHAKIVVIDGDTTFVGSMNMDFRSSRENTEIGMLVHSRQLAQQVISLFNQIQTTGTYHVRLASDGKSMEWTALENGTETTYESEPEVSFGRRLEMFLLAPFVSQHML
jgi:putative cardiolipin synthase